MKLKKFWFVGGRPPKSATAVKLIDDFQEILIFD